MTKKLNSKNFDRSSVRLDFQEMNFLQVVNFMQKEGWGTDFSSDGYEEKKHEYFAIRFNRWDWHGGVTGNSVGYGFRTPDLTGMPNKDRETEILWACRRAAELCLTVWEFFPDDLPASPNIYGEIEPQFDQINTSWRQYRDKLRDHPEELFARRERTANRIFDADFEIFENNGYFKFEVQNREVLLTTNDIKRFLEAAHALEGKFNGDLAIGVGV